MGGRGETKRAQEDQTLLGLTWKWNHMLNSVRRSCCSMPGHRAGAHGLPPTLPIFDQNQSLSSLGGGNSGLVTIRGR